MPGDCKPAEIDLIIPDLSPSGRVADLLCEKFKVKAKAQNVHLCSINLATSFETREKGEKDVINRN